MYFLLGETLGLTYTDIYTKKIMIFATKSCGNTLTTIVTAQSNITTYW